MENEIEHCPTFLCKQMRKFMFFRAHTFCIQIERYSVCYFYVQFCSILFSENELFSKTIDFYASNALNEQHYAW